MNVNGNRGRSINSVKNLQRTMNKQARELKKKQKEPA